MTRSGSAGVDARLAFACDWIRSAGRHALAAAGRPAETLAGIDREIEEGLRAQIRSAFPGDVVVGEELGGVPGAATWIVDPIDGTGNYVRELPAWCVSVAFVLDGAVEFGLTYHPPSGELFYARRDTGAFLNGKPVAVSGWTGGKAAMIEIGKQRHQSAHGYGMAIAQVEGGGNDFIRIDAGALTLAWIACGRIDGYVDLKTELWDGLAGILLVREAGGWVNGFADRALCDGHAPLLACTPGLERILEPLLAILADE